MSPSSESLGVFPRRTPADLPEFCRELIAAVQEKVPA